MGTVSADHPLTTRPISAKSKYTGKALVLIQPNELLNQKTLNAIPGGGIACGWIVFQLPTLSVKAARHGIKEYRVHFADVFGNQFTATETGPVVQEFPNEITCGERVIKQLRPAIQEI
jgi:hypothetical protein